MSQFFLAKNALFLLRKVDTTCKLCYIDDRMGIYGIPPENKEENIVKKVTFAVMGMGNRGERYANKQLRYPDMMEVVAIADTNPLTLKKAKTFLDLPEERIFNSGEEMLQQPKMADIMVIATQDAQHRDHAIKAMERGYDLLLEKPIANTAEDCMAILEAAHKYNRRVIVCHVLRYTIFYQEIKKLIDSGALGEIQTIQASEQVGWFHIAHSFVRGNWHKKADSSPMILAKCCHDMDLFLWLTGKKCKAVSSFGDRRFFNKEHCPENAAERCINCPVSDCAFNAVSYYIPRIPGWPTHVLNPQPTVKNIIESLQTTNYGRCVFQMDNDVVDHQVVNLLMEDGSTVNFVMSGFTGEQNRSIHIMGSKADLIGDFDKRTFTLRQFGKKPKVVDLNPLYTDTTGHGGGDARMVHDVLRLYLGEDFDTSAITVIDRSMESHFVALAAELSREQNGELVKMDEFIDNLKTK